MRVRTFKPQCAPLVESGAKRQTIRPMPKRIPKEGDVESWRQWTGRPYHSPQRELAKIRIVSVELILISYRFIEVNCRPLLPHESNVLAKRDGFAGVLPMLDWFEREHGLPFTGILILAENL